MAVVVQRKGQKLFTSVAKFGIGTVGGVLLNDGWEILKLPGYFVTLFNVGNIGIGVDDIIQTAVGGLIALSPALREIGFGIIAGTWLTKFGEQAGYKIQIIPHEALPPSGAAFNPSGTGDNRLTGYAGGYANDGNYNSFKASKQTNSGGSFAEDTITDSELTLGDTLGSDADFSVNTG